MSVPADGSGRLREVVDGGVPVAWGHDLAYVTVGKDFEIWHRNLRTGASKRIHSGTGPCNGGKELATAAGRVAWIARCPRLGYDEVNVVGVEETLTITGKRLASLVLTPRFVAFSDQPSPVERLDGHNNYVYDFKARQLFKVGRGHGAWIVYGAGDYLVYSEMHAGSFVATSHLVRIE